MQRLVILALLGGLALGVSSDAPAQTPQLEKEAGRLLFRGAMIPCAAGPGKVAFLRLDPKIPQAPMELIFGDVKTLSETRALPGVDFKTLPSLAYAVSPDGSDIVIQQTVSGCWELYRYRSGSRTGEKLTSLIQYRDKLSQEMMMALGLTEDMMLFVGEVAYSPSGKRLVLTVNRPSKTAVWWHDLQTGRTRQATEDQTGYYGSFHPNDDQICYTANLVKEGITTDEDILLRSIKRGTIDTLCHTSSMEYGGTISPDGKYLAFVKTGDNSNNLFVLNIATRETKQLTFAPKGKHCIYPRWSPDGKQIFFQGTGFLDTTAIFVKDFMPF